jgi:hypothetical protein
VRTRVWRDWLPDIYLNPHGYPSHEWVQPFAGYVPPGFRTYLSTRGWYTTIGTLRDPRYPESRRGDRGGPRGDRPRDQRQRRRPRDGSAPPGALSQMGVRLRPYVFNQEIYKDTAIYYTDPETGEARGSRRFGAGAAAIGANGAGGGTGAVSMNAWPQVTFFSGGTRRRTKPRRASG